MGVAIRPVRVWHEETVEIQWQLPDGKVFWERHTCPAPSMREAVEHDRTEMDRIRQQALGLEPPAQPIALE